MLLGDRVKKFLAPWVKGTRFENCAGCERRRQLLNKASIRAADVVAATLCPCTYQKAYVWLKTAFLTK